MADFARILPVGLDDFARNKADQLVQDGTALNQELNLSLAGFVASIASLILLLTWYLIRGIRQPLDDLTQASEQFGQGKLDARSHYVARNELGDLATTFNTMATAIEAETRARERVAQLSGVMHQEEDAHGFCQEVLKALLEQTHSQLGAVYLLNDAGTVFEHFESIGLGESGRAAFCATALEGELGAALATGQIQHIRGIEANTRFVLPAVSGDFRPHEILTIPLRSGATTEAIVSLASLHAYDSTDIRLIQDVWGVLTARMNSVLTLRRVQHLVQQLEHQNLELDSQKQALTVQSYELTQQNTELEMQKREIGEANRLKTAFLSNMSHELRTPLNSVIALSGVLSRRLEKTIPQDEYSYLQVIERNGKNLLTLINDILDLSRIEAGREEISISQFSLYEVVSDLVSMLAPQTLESAVALKNHVPRDLPLLSSDATKLTHILQNLMGNAVKFTPQGSVEVSAQHNDGELQVTVRDSGIGIAADQLPHIFDEFRQADDSTSRRFGGTGLGLAIAKKYAVLLGGNILVASEPGQGSTFTLRLPLKAPATGPVPDSRQSLLVRHATATPAADGKGKRILVVEDSEPAIVQLTDILSRQGYALRVARNGQQALEQIEQELPDAMILDLMMPGVDGFEVLKTIRSIERTRDIPVLILTAKHVTRDELSFLTSNHIFQLIQKGDVNQHELLTAVARMVAPVAPVPASPRRPIARPEREGKPVVLIVEDNPDSLLSAKTLLADRYLIVEATNGRLGVEQAGKHRPDAVLMDISMPVMDGIEALHEIRKNDTLDHIPIIALTASAMKGDRETVMAYGFDDYLTKPVDAALLHKALQAALD